MHLGELYDFVIELNAICRSILSNLRSIFSKSACMVENLHVFLHLIIIPAKLSVTESALAALCSWWGHTPVHLPVLGS